MYLLFNSFKVTKRDILLLNELLSFDMLIRIKSVPKVIGFCTLITFKYRVKTCFSIRNTLVSGLFDL